MRPAASAPKRADFTPRGPCTPNARHTPSGVRACQRMQVFLDLVRNTGSTGVAPFARSDM